MQYASHAAAYEVQDVLPHHFGFQPELQTELGICCTSVNKLHRQNDVQNKSVKTMRASNSKTGTTVVHTSSQSQL